MIIVYSTLPKTVEAQLIPEEGVVTLNDDQVDQKTDLEEDDIIETKEDSYATVILFESIIINLDPNTKITLTDLMKEHPVVDQEFGSTWSKFTGLLGVESYTIKSDTTFASVRGTSFQFLIDENGEKVFTEEGRVDVRMRDKNFILTANQVAEDITGEAIKREATDEERGILSEKDVRLVKSLTDLRDEELQKHPVLVESIKMKYNADEEDFKRTMDEIDQGMYSVDALVERAPVKTEGVLKVAELTKQIQMINEKNKEK
jgi:hypothetical protein